MVMIFGFALAGMNIFGQESAAYIDPLEAFATMFLTCLGQYDFDEMLLINDIFAYIFFIVYQVFVFLIMVNIFLAILNDAYIAIKEKFDAEEREPPQPSPTIRQRIRMAREWLRQRQLDRRIEDLRREQRRLDLAEKRKAVQTEKLRQKTLRAVKLASEKVASTTKPKASSTAKAKASTSRGNPSP